MKKKETGIQTVRVEILRPATVAPAAAEVLRDAVKKQVAEILANHEQFIFQPFFNQKKVSDEIRRMQNVPEQRKWSIYYMKYGCVLCGERQAGHSSCGMCGDCCHRVRDRLQRIVREYKSKSEDEYKEFCRDEKMARRALIAPPQAEREEAARDRIATREKRALRAETLRHAQDLHDNHGWSWKALAEKYEPNFSKDPEAATLRMRIAARECVPPSARKPGAQLKHEKSARNAELWRQARALHMEQGLTWDEITQRLDPEGYARNPKAAIARMLTGSWRVSKGEQ